MKWSDQGLKGKLTHYPSRKGPKDVCWRACVDADILKLMLCFQLFFVINLLGSSFEICFRQTHPSSRITRNTRQYLRMYDCQTASIFIYLQGMVTVCHVYPFPVQHRMPDCVVALWWRSTLQRTSRRLPCCEAVDFGEWFQDRICVRYHYYRREFIILLVKGDIDSQWFRKLHWILVGKLCIAARWSVGWEHL